MKEEGLEPITPPSGSHTEMRAIMLLMFSIMVLFFGFFLLIPAFFIGSSIFFLVCIAMIVLGFVMLIARFYILSKYSRKIEEFRAEAVEKVKCQYCGSMNPVGAERCIGCHAPL